MKNYNPISRKAIQTGNKFGYLETDQIPNFSFDGSNIFTIGCNFCLREENTNSSIYKQGDAFELGFNNLKLYFKSPFGNFEIDDDTLKFNINIWYNINILYNLNEIIFYVNGLKIKTFKKTVIEGSNGEFSMGNNFNGFIESVYLYSICLSDSEILANYTSTLCKSDKLIAWFDFTENRIYDKSKNKIAVHQGKGSMVVISNLCSVLSLEKTGYITINNFKSAKEEFSFLTKLYPLSRDPGTIATLYSNFETENQIGISIDLEYADYHNSIVTIKLKTLQNTEKSIKSDIIIKSNSWNDIGYTYSNGKISLYINGKIAGSAVNIALECLDGCGTDYLGASLADNQLINQFKGYISYVAKFDKLLSIDNYNKYIQNPPYALDNKISSLLYFSDFSSIDMVSFREYNLSDGSKFDYAVDTQNVDTITTQTVAISDDSCKRWGDYGASDQWNIEQYAIIISEYCKASGLIPKLEEDWFKKPSIANYLNNSLESNPHFPNLLNKGYGMTQVDVSLVLGASIVVIGITSIVFGLGKLGVKVGMSTFCGIVFSATLTEILLGALASVAIVAITICLAKIIVNVINNLIDRPDPEPDPEQLLQILLVKSNFITAKENPQISAIDITKDGEISISNEDRQDAVCYVTNQIKTPKVKLSIKCVANTQPEAPVKLKGEDRSENRLLGDFISSNFLIAPGETKEIEVELKNNKLNEKNICAKKTDWYLSFEGIEDGFVGNLSQKVYTVFGIPVLPWKYNNKGTVLPWTKTLDVAYKWINENITKDVTIDVVLEQLTKNINNSGYKFDIDTGQPFYAQLPKSENGLIAIDLQKLNEDYSNKRFNEVSVNSVDCSIILATLARLHGININLATLVAGKFNQGFHINKVQPIGFKNPIELFSNPTDSIGFLAYHSIAVNGDNFDWTKMLVYDSSLQILDSSSTPQLQIKKKLTNINNSMVVDNNDKGSYRGTLVKQGEVNVLETPCITSWELNTKKAVEGQKS